MNFDSADKLTCIVRQVDTAPPAKDLGMKFMVRISNYLKKSVIRYRFVFLLQHPDKSGASVLAPGISMAPRAGNKRKNSESGKVDDLPMLER